MDKKSFPEQPHTRHQGDEKPAHIKSSKKVGAGHEDHTDRMPHPFGSDWSNKETGEGQN